MIDILGILLKFIAAVAAVIGGLWALTRYVIERGLVPAAEMDIDCNIIGEKDMRKIVEFTVHIVNRGSAVLVASDIRLVLKCICERDSLMVYEDDIKLGRLQFPHSLSKELTQAHEGEEKGAFLLVPHDTFVQPGVDQAYSFVTLFNLNVEFVHAHAAFNYAQQPKPFQSFILSISRQIGLIHYSLQHIYESHTLQKAFSLKSARHPKGDG